MASQVQTKSRTLLGFWPVEAASIASPQPLFVVCTVLQTLSLRCDTRGEDTEGPVTCCGVAAILFSFSQLPVWWLWVCLSHAGIVKDSLTQVLMFPRIWRISI